MSPARSAGWLRFLAWRQWGVLYLNPVFENTFVFFYVFLIEHTPFSEVYGQLGLFIALILAMSSYGFLLNDAVDCERDLGHGDDNVFAGLSPARSTAVVLLALACNIPLLVHFADLPYFTVTWILWFAVTTVYSLPVLYVKGRGLTGLIAVTLAMRTLPTLLILEAFDPTPDLAWILMVAYVSVRGFTGDLAHQLHDFDEDRVDHISTFAIRWGFDRSFTLLDRSLELERYALLICCGWLLWTVHGVDRSPVILAFDGIILMSTAMLVVYANRQIRRTPHIDPHQPVYPQKDVFYLLHKTFPKVLLSLYLAALLVLADPYWSAVVALLAIHFRVFSLSRLRAALRIKPKTGGDVAH